MQLSRRNQRVIYGNVKNHAPRGAISFNWVLYIFMIKRARI